MINVRDNIQKKTSKIEYPSTKEMIKSISVIKYKIQIRLEPIYVVAEMAVFKLMTKYAKH